MARFINLKIEIDVWDWSTGRIKETLDITKDILTYRFQKTIKSPSGSCQIQMLPQSADKNILDVLSPMDAVKIYEFGTLKFQGYIKRIAYSGSIGQDGKPNRSGILTISHMGNLLIEAKTGMGLGVASGNAENLLWLAAEEMSTAIEQGVNDGGLTYKELIILVIDSLKGYVEKLGGKYIITYLEEYLSYGTGITDSLSSVIPRSQELYSGTETALAFWGVIENIVNRPFNELFVDDGPRKIVLDGTETSLKEGSHIIFRPVPFDSSEETPFSNMESIYIDKDHITKFDLSKSMDEVYSVYSVKNAAFEHNSFYRELRGMWNIDESKLGKYTFRPLVVEQMNTRVESIADTESEVTNKLVEDETQRLADILQSWFTHNDEFLSGAITMMVPSDASVDPKIGDKVTMYGLEGSFYVEGISHQWTYGGALTSNLSVTRGYNADKPIELSSKIFRRRQA